MSFNPLLNLKCLFFLFICLLLQTATYSQDRSGYNLLWKIEGKNLTKPSYLFGTMHVDDSRAFKFSDAVLPAIESSDIFALEINPDSLVIAMTNKIIEKEPEEVFQGLLNDEEYNLLVERFKEVNTYTFEGSGLKDPNTILALLMPDTDKSDDESLFVDLFLYNQARTMRKSITGLEDMDEQLNYFENLSQDNQRQYVLEQIKDNVETMNYDREKLTEIYYRGNIQAIDSMIKTYDGYDLELSNRNHVMAKSIINIIQDNSLFSAVGAAHLPGENGVIALLKNEGYQVTPVEASFTGVSENYKIDESKMNWFTFEDPKLGYHVEVPEEPNFSEDFPGFTLHLYKGLYNNAMYLFCGINISAKPESTDKKELIEKFINTMSTSYDGSLQSMQEIPIKTGIRYEGLINLEEGELMKVQVTIENDILFYLAAQDQVDAIANPSIQRFFNSLTITEPEVSEDKPWINHHNTLGAFSIDIPEEPKNVSRDQPNPYDLEGEPYKLNMYMVTDYPKSDNYLFRYNDLPIGYYMENTKEGFDEIKASFESKGTLLSPEKVIYLNGYEGREYEIKIQGKYHSICRVYFRGNRTYLLLHQKLNETDEAPIDSPFLSSFKFEDYETSELTLLKPEGTAFQIPFFEKQKVEIDTVDYDGSYLKNSHDYYTENPKSGGVYQFGYSDLQEYFKITSKKEFYDLNKEAMISWNDTVVKETPIKIDNHDGIEIYVENKNTQTKRRHRYWLQDKRFFMISAFVANEELENEITETMLKDFKSNTSKKSFDVFASKTEAILSDLKSKDSIRYKRAFGALSYYEFEATDLPKLYQALPKRYTDTLKTDNIKNGIVDAFYTLHDDKTLGVLETEYLNKQNTDRLKTNILLTIPVLPNKNVLEVYSRLLFNNPPKDLDSYVWNTLAPFKDSLQLSETHYSKLLTLMFHNRFRRDVLNISTDILTDSLISNQNITDNFDILTDYTQNDLNSYLESKESEDGYDYTYNSLMFSYLGLFNAIEIDNPLIDSFTNTLIEKDDNNWLIAQAVSARIHNNLHVVDTLITSYLNKDSHSLDIITAFHKAGTLNRVPESYLDTKKIAEIKLFEYASEDYEPNKLEYLGTVTKDTKSYYMYTIHYETEEGAEPETYIGIAGPIENITQNKPLVLPYAYSSWDEPETDWETQGLKLIPDLIEYGY